MNFLFFLPSRGLLWLEDLLKTEDLLNIFFVTEDLLNTLYIFVLYIPSEGLLLLDFLEVFYRQKTCYRHSFNRRPSKCNRRSSEHLLQMEDIFEVLYRWSASKFLLGINLGSLCIIFSTNSNLWFIFTQHKYFN